MCSFSCYSSIPCHLGLNLYFSGYNKILPILRLILLIRGLFRVLKAHGDPLGTPNENVSVRICGLIHLDFSGCTKIYPVVVVGRKRVSRVRILLGDIAQK